MAIPKLTRKNFDEIAVYSFSLWFLENSLQAVPSYVKRALEREESCSQNFPVLESMFSLRKTKFVTFEGKTKNFKRPSKQQQYLEPGAICQPMCKHILHPRENPEECTPMVRALHCSSPPPLCPPPPFSLTVATCTLLTPNHQTPQ